ncbi:MAG: hypothetical protein ACLRWQ_21355 [Flavonifractor plautii]
MAESWGGIGDESLNNGCWCTPGENKNMRCSGIGGRLPGLKIEGLLAVISTGVS